MLNQTSNVPIPTVGEHPRVLPLKNNGRFRISKKIVTRIVFQFGARIYTRERTRARPCIIQIQDAPSKINYHTVTLGVGMPPIGSVILSRFLAQDL